MNFKNTYHIFVAAIAILFMSSCKQSLFLQRKYTKGIYTEGHSAVKQPATHSAKEKVFTPNILKQAYQDKISSIKLISKNHPIAFASVSKKMPLSNKDIYTLRDISFTDDCDKIVLRNGKIISCKVYEISEEEIKYRLCNQPYGVYYHAQIEDANKIIFANGTEEVFKIKKELPKAVINDSEKEPINNKLVNFALFGYVISAFFSLVIGAVSGIVLLIGVSLLLFIFALLLSFLCKKRATKRNPIFLLALGALLGSIIVAAGVILIIGLIAVVALL